MLIKNEKWNFYTYFICQFVSLMGSSLQMSIAPIFILEISKSPGVMGGGSAILTIVNIAGMYIGGIIADKYDAKKVIIGSDFINGGILLIYIMFFNDKNILNFMTLSSLLVFSSAIFSSANNSLFARISPDFDLEKKGSLLEIGSNICSIAGPILSVTLYSIYGIKIIFILNLLSFLISGVIEFFLNVKPIEVRDSSLLNKVNEKEKDSYKVIIEYLKENVFLRENLKLSLIANFLLNPFFSFVMIFFLRETIKLPTIYLGYVQSIIAFSLLIGSTFVYKYGKKYQLKSMYFQLTYVQNFFILSFYLVTYLLRGNILVASIFAVVSLVTFMAVNTIKFIPFNALQHEKVDPSIKGKYFSFTSSIKTGLMPLSLALVGFALEKFNVVAIATVSTVAMILIQFYFLKFRNLEKSYKEFVKS